MKPEGLLTVVTDNARYWHFFWGISGKEEYHGSHPDDQHFAIYQPYHLRNHFERAGFKVDGYDYVPYAGHGQKKIDSLLRLLGRESALPRVKKTWGRKA
ncbi:MAG: hypothetical protein HY296_01695 [Thaumarchaeota archaeon]|nr:hypothetical protein [Nitrososphaerota archaeon]